MTTTSSSSGTVFVFDLFGEAFLGDLLLPFVFSGDSLVPLSEGTENVGSAQ